MLPALVRTLRVSDDGAEEEAEEHAARIVAAEAALEALDGLAEEEWHARTASSGCGGCTHSAAAASRR